MKSIILVLFCCLPTIFLAQNNLNTNGVHSKNTPTYVFENATVHINGENSIHKGTVIIKQNKIIYVGGKTKTPNNAIVTDLEGKHIYPAFIELNSDFGLPSPIVKKKSNYPQYTSSIKGAYYWNEAIHPEVNAIQDYSYDAKKAKELRKLGFATVLTHKKDGIVRGTGALVSLTDTEHYQIIEEKVSSHYSFKKGTSHQVYPTSLMGSIALLRQYNYDGMYYETNIDTENKNLSLEAYAATKNYPKIIDVGDKLSVLRASKIADEFNQNFIIVGNGDEYQELVAIKTTKSTLVVPLSFPKAYDVSNPFDAQYVTLSQLKHWELAPTNLMQLAKDSIAFAITSSKLKKGESFLNNLRKAVSHGLTEADALNALTIVPATLIGADQELGTLTKGKLANFIITSNNIFEKDAIIYENWVQGKKYTINQWNMVDVRGTYNLNVNQITRTLKITGELSKPKGQLVYDMIVDSISKSGDLVIDAVLGKPIKITKEKKVPVTVKVEKDYITLSYTLTEGTYRLAGNINYDSGSWDGKGQDHRGEWLVWVAIRKEKNNALENAKKEKNNEQIDSIQSPKFNYPMMAYGWDSLPRSQPILIKNATLWTLEDKGTYQSDLLIRNGKIAMIAKILDVVDQNTLVIDGTGMHVTPGIIDEHSHIAIQSGVNEGSHAITAEVRIGDVLRNNDINIYRQLAGGTTACQLLHGSANPIGGQSALIKLRWGQSPEQMKIKEADGFIKFALGENVKQSNWGNFNTIRFPQTRMGVEQVYYDAFIRAKEYDTQWKSYLNKSHHGGTGKKKRNKEENITPPKRDLQLDALVEILNKERFVSCHSYVQSEINMLIHVADSMDFTLNTFTHILEGYKVADKLKEHGAGGSTFSDWWAYKFEVQDAIPHNASLLNQMGIITAINSDDAEMGRRLNQEAAKGLKYGGMTEEEALKMVTLNPAKLLHLDHRMGSLKVGKDADVVLWTANPLSIYARVENTIIDGVVYFDAKRNIEMQKEIRKERQRLIHKMIAAKNAGADTQKVKPKEQQIHNCSGAKFID